MYNLVARDCEQASFDGFERNQKSSRSYASSANIRDNAAAQQQVFSSIAIE